MRLVLRYMSRYSYVFSTFPLSSGQDEIRPKSGNEYIDAGIVDVSAGGRPKNRPLCARLPPFTPRFVIRGDDETYVQHDVNDGVVMEISITERTSAIYLG